MNYETVLNQLEKSDLSIEDAYRKLYKPKKIKTGKRAFFVKMNITIPDEGKGLNTFLRILFALPIPLVFARIGISIANRYTNLDDNEIDLKQISRLLKYSRGTKIDVDSEDAKVSIRLI